MNHLPLPWTGLASLQCQFMQQLLGGCAECALIIGDGNTTFRVGLLGGPGAAGSQEQPLQHRQRRQASKAPATTAFLGGNLV
jgi:hypothetical protein